MKRAVMVLTVGLATGFAVPTGAQTTTDLNNQAAQMNSLAASQGQTKVINKTSSDFNSFLGSDSTAVVTGLRNGTSINLSRTTTTPSTTGGAPVTTTTTTTITPPTGQMGHGEVYISLALAKQQLGQMGITEPTPQQLQAALTGGTITQTNGTGPTATTTTTQLRGILTMRSEKMGWGKIAQEQGTKLGPVMSSMKSANHNLTTTTQSTSTTTTQTASTSKGKGVTTASNGSGKGSSSQIVSAGGKANGNLGQGHSVDRGSGRGIVTASGRSGGGNAYGRSGAVVTASGQNGGSSASGVSGNGSQGSGNGKGHNK